LLSDTVLRNTLMQSALHLEEGTGRFNENMEALKSNFFFRGYFRKLEKQRRQKEKAQEQDQKPKKPEEEITKENKSQE